MTSVHRLHWRPFALVIGLGLVIAAVIGILLAVGNSEPAAPTFAGATAQAGTTSSAGGPPLLSGNPFGGGAKAATKPPGSVTVDTIAISPPSGWTVVQKNHVSLMLSDPAKDGLVGLLSGTLSGSPTATEFGQSLVDATLEGTTNAKVCGKIAKGPLPNGPQGLIIPLCYTIMPQNGQAIQVYEILVASVSGDLGRSVKFVTPAQSSVLDDLLTESTALLPSVKWRLLT